MLFWRVVQIVMVRSDRPISGVNFPPQGGDVGPRSSDLRVVFRPQLLFMLEKNDICLEWRS